MSWQENNHSKERHKENVEVEGEQKEKVNLHSVGCLFGEIEINKENVTRCVHEDVFGLQIFN